MGWSVDILGEVRIGRKTAYLGETYFRRNVVMKEITTSQTPSAIGPYSQGIVAGGLVFTSGQLGVDVRTGELGRNIQEQTRLALINVQSVVGAAGGTLGRVIKVMIFLADVEDFAQVNEIYASFFSKPYPARSCVQAARLPKDALVEIEAICQLTDP